MSQKNALMALMMLLGLLLGVGVEAAHGVYGDIHFKRMGAREKPEEVKRVPPAVFPHWLHRTRFRCLVCHPYIFKMEKGANDITMKGIRAGEFCGKCHNGKTAFSPEIDTCYRCHQSPPTMAVKGQEDGISPQEEKEAGREVYDKWCLPCHGVQGKGDGPAAPFFDPKPRNFVEGQFKIRTTPSGELPTDADIVKIIMNGMPGSTMPRWEGLITEREAKQAITHIKTLMEEWVLEGGVPEPIVIGEPVPPTKESLAMGKELFDKLKCWECHGEKGEGDGPSAPSLEDDWGFPIKAANLTMGWNFRGGSSITDIYRTITTGLNGTPMPSFADTISDEERWHLANYVKSLSKEKKPMAITFWEWTKD